MDSWNSRVSNGWLNDGIWLIVYWRSGYKPDNPINHNTNSRMGSCDRRNFEFNSSNFQQLNSIDFIFIFYTLH